MGIFDHFLDALSLTRVGKTDVYRWMPFPTFSSAYYAKSLENIIVASHADVGVSEERMALLLSRVAVEHIHAFDAEHTDSVFETDFGAHFSQRHIWVCSPRFPYCFPGKSQLMNSHTAFVTPVYRCEVTGGMAESTRERFDRLPFNTPDREPSPALNMRYKHPGTGRMSTGKIARPVFPWAKVLAAVEALPTAGGFAEVENWERVVIRIVFEDGRWLISQGKTRWQPFDNEMMPWLRAFAFESFETAMKGISR